MADKPKLIRKRDTLFLEDGVTVYQKFDSISKSKRASRLYQMGGGKVSVDRSDDPKPQPLNFGHSPGGKRRFYVSPAEERKIAAMRKRESSDLVERTRQQLGLSKSQMLKVGTK